jgi:hypothetical protein
VDSIDRQFICRAHMCREPVESSSNRRQNAKITITTIIHINQDTTQEQIFSLSSLLPTSSFFSHILRLFTRQKGGSANKERVSRLKEKLILFVETFLPILTRCLFIIRRERKPRTLRRRVTLLCVDSCLLPFSSGYGSGVEC